MSQILIVEDEALTAGFLADSLLELGYQVCARCHTAAEALEMAEKFRPDLVLVDLQLDGIETARRLRSLQNLPCVCITDPSDFAALDQAAEIDPLTKPYHTDELRSAIELALYRHRADLERLKLDSWLATTLECIGDGVMTIDLDRKVSFLNQAAQRLTGWTAREGVGRHFSEVYALVEESTGESRTELVEECFRSGQVLQLDDVYALRTRAGTLMPVDDSVAPLAQGLVVIFRDRTHRAEAERDRSRLERQRNDNQRLETLGLLAAGIAHDFNNLLTIVRGNADLCLENKLPEQSEYLAEIVSAADRGSELCSQMLSYAGQAPMEPETLDLSVVLSQCLQLARRLKSDCEYTLMEVPDPVLVRGDRRQIQQVLLNLLINASEAYGDSAGQVSVLLGAVSGSAVVEISDRGCGMSEETACRIFEPFFSTKQTGRGLGLAAVAGIVRAHHGELSVNSQLGRGSTFRLQLPLDKALPGTGNLRAEITSHPLTGKRVLVADDEEPIRRLLRLALMRAGALVVEACNGLQAWEFLQSPIDFDFAVLDVVMPELGGREVVERLRAEGRALPILLISGYDPSQARVEHTPFLAKPFSLPTLFQAVAAL